MLANFDQSVLKVVVKISLILFLARPENNI
jgi:hypothetical protein